MEMLRWLLGWLVGRTCFGCAAVCGAELCEGCCAELRRAPNAAPLAAFVDGGRAGELVRAAKFGQWRYAARHLAPLLVTRCELNAAAFDVVACVPSSRRRAAQRGASLPEALAVEVGDVLEVAVHTRALRRRVRSRPQRGQSRDARLANAGRSFLVDRGVPHGARVLLVDDVHTTGATTAVCAQLLRDAGAAHVRVVVLLDVDRPRNDSAKITASCVDFALTTSVLNAEELLPRPRKAAPRS